ncbi:protein adenylyltransferase SelO-like [Liolophura sinensis]|uniref:protein adenylyltransferase SelO-like n=1 Tax=Liolophura sinensis TaxID=3198878 RepID=UPI0031586D6E
MAEWETHFAETGQILSKMFPVDPEETNYVRRVKNVVFSRVYPQPFKTKVRLVAVSDSALRYVLNMHPNISSDVNFVRFVAGGYLPSGSTPLAHRYGGHQFGEWAGQLGDGRAVMLGEFVNMLGERWEMQLKGSGRTPYSRRGDGRAVLRSSVREFLCSEALYHLGVPTSRAAALVVSDDPVMRDQFYDGNVLTERGAVVLRLAKSWFRIGSLEILSYNGEFKILRQLVDFVIHNYFPHISSTNPNKYVEFFREVVLQTTKLLALWQSLGFAHGVCNTDNFSLLSITIDFGPFGFLDSYNPGFVPNASDDDGRYSFEKQPDVGHFNMEKLRQALLPLLNKAQEALSQTVLDNYAEEYKKQFMCLYGEKLGLNLSVVEDHENFVAVLLKMMEDTQADFTMTFRQLGEISLAEMKIGDVNEEVWALRTLSKHKWFPAWTRMYGQLLSAQGISDLDRMASMLNVNPRYVLRNWIAQNAIAKAKVNDFSYVYKVLQILEKPFTEQPEAEELGFSGPPPYWASSLKVSCSS